MSASRRDMHGSSPLARGLRLRAGAATYSPVDHPRSRGVYACTCFLPWYWRGSSPLARGLRLRVGAQGQPGRIIPARAGFTSPRCGTTSSTRDHPRSRGVYPNPSIRFPMSPGSSPLARGLRPRRLSVRFMVRIIPARAGFTNCAPPTASPTADHPRSRGVYTRSSRAWTRPDGSSPLARGLPRGPASGRRRSGIIPARAGFTSGLINAGRPD